MLKIKFFKYEGTGNDFIMIHDPEKDIEKKLTEKTIAYWCHRRFGIGADGLILIQPESGFDFRMVYFNADGRQSSMCGNGGRCAAYFAQKLGICGDHVRFVAIDGPHAAEIEAEQVHLGMIDVHEIQIQPQGHIELNTGSPHLIVWSDQLDQLDVDSEGRTIRYSAPYQKEGINVNFSEACGANELKIRTYERGVEAETLSCGTGVTAAAIAAAVSKGFASPVNIKTPGGELQISFERQGNSFTSIVLKGPVKEVYSGEIMPDWQRS